MSQFGNCETQYLRVTEFGSKTARRET